MLGVDPLVIVRPRQQHWLPIHWRIQYKLNVLMHGIITGKCPNYLQTIVT